MNRSILTTISVTYLLLLCMLLTACQTSAPPTSTTASTPPVLEPESPAVAGETPEPSDTTPIVTPVSDVSVKELKDKLDNGDELLLVDVRSTAEYNRGYIDSALSIPLEEIHNRYHEITQNKEVIVYSGCA